MVEHQTTLVKNLLLDNLTRQKYSMKKKSYSTEIQIKNWAVIFRLYFFFLCS